MAKFLIKIGGLRGGNKILKKTNIQGGPGPAKSNNPFGREKKVAHGPKRQKKSALLQC